jgi:hypothetical protein
MKHLKSCAAAVLALLAADAAIAQTVIKITGSTAFRSATISSIKNLMQPGFDQAYTGTSASGFQYGTFVGIGNSASGLNGQALVVQCAWTGAEEGLRDVTQGLNQPFIKASVVPNTNGAGVADTTVNFSSDTANTTNYEQAIPDITLQDSAQSLSLFNAPVLNSTRVGVIPFVWLKGRVAANHPAFDSYTNALTNMTNLQAQAVLAAGANLSLLTGNANDIGTKVYVVGRNPLSGTRSVTLNETGYGTTTPVLQVKPTVLGNVTTGTITGMGAMPDDLVNNFIDGNNGFTSGGTLVDELGRTVTNIDGLTNDLDGVPFALVGYVGIGDAARMVKNIYGASPATVNHILTYNGTSLNPVYNTVTQAIDWDLTQVTNGKYPFWSYVYVGYRQGAGPNGTSALTGTAKTYADNLASNIITTLPAASGVKLSDMLVQRSSEGAPITSL